MELTLQKLLVNYSGAVHQGIEYAKSFYPEYPKTPIKPILSKNHDSVELRKYNSEFIDYETNMKSYRIKKDIYNKAQGEINDIIEAFIKDESGFNNYVPDDKKGKVWAKAWSDGHSSGYSEVYGCLCGLVELFE